MLTPLTASETVTRARKALQSGRGAGLPELLKLIESLSTNLGKATITEIADLIERDAAVLSRVLTVANTIMHNPSVAPLTSIPQAIHQLGFHRVRSLAVSLMLVENTGGINPIEQREAASQALCAGLLAQGCAQSLGMIDPELAFACGALRKFGLILLPVISVELYQEMQRLKMPYSDDQACRECFGLTPLELSRALLSDSRLPEEIIQSLRTCQPESMGGTVATTYGSRLLGIADFGGRLANLALDGSSNAELFGDRSRALTKLFSKLLPGVEETVDASLIHTDERLGSFTQGQHNSSFYAAGLRHIKTRILHESPVESLLITATTIPFVSKLAKPLADDLRPKRVADLIKPEAPISDIVPKGPPDRNLPGSNEVKESSFNPPTGEEWINQLTQSQAFETQAVVAAPKNQAWPGALAFACDSFKAPLAWMFTAPSRGKPISLTHSFGPGAPESQGNAVLNFDERTVFGVCLSRGENVVIHDSTEAKLAPYLPKWFLNHNEPPGAFILMPLFTNQVTTGLVLIGWQNPQRIALTPAQTEIARQLFASTLT